MRRAHAPVTQGAANQLTYLDERGNEKIVRQAGGESSSGLAQVFSSLSGCLAPGQVRLHTLEYLSQMLQARGAAWLKIDRRGPEFTRALTSVPRKVDISRVLFDLPLDRLSLHRRIPVITQTSRGKSVLIPCQHTLDASLYVWEVHARLTPARLTEVTQVLSHGELSLYQLQRFEEVKRQSYVDDLTGLYNARYLRHSLTCFLKKASHLKQRFGVLFIDIDHFKKINDAHGHLVGSEFLIALGRTIRAAVREADLVFRYGGDEFVVLLDTANESQSLMVAERIRASVERREYHVGGHTLKASVSVGVACYPEHAETEHRLLELADAALYAAKRESRNCVYLNPRLK